MSTKPRIKVESASAAPNATQWVSIEARHMSLRACDSGQVFTLFLNTGGELEARAAWAERFEAAARELRAGIPAPTEVPTTT